MSTLEDLKTRMANNDAEIDQLKKEIEALERESKDETPRLMAKRADKLALIQANEKLTAQIVELESKQLDLDKEKEKTKQGAAQVPIAQNEEMIALFKEFLQVSKPKTTASLTYTQSYLKTEKAFVSADSLFGFTQLTEEQLRDWKGVLEANRGKDETREVQPAAMKLFLRLANANGNNVAIDNGIDIMGKYPDLAIYPASRPVESIHNIKCLGEMKTPPPAVKQPDNHPPVLTNFSYGDKGQAMNYCVNLLESCRYRQVVYTFLTDLEVVVIFQGKRKGYKIEITETHPLAYDQGGAAAILSLLLLPGPMSGLVNPVVPGWTLGDPIGSGATSIAFKVTKENPHTEAVFKYVFKQGRCLKTEVDFLTAVKGVGLPVKIDTTNEGFIMTPELKPFSKRPQKIHVEQLFSALKIIHEAKYVTRDVRPTNVMLSLDEQQAFITDFGFATEVGAVAVYEGTLTTASDHILNILKDGMKTPVVGVTIKDEQESLVKCLHLMTHNPPMGDVNQITDYWSQLTGVWRRILDEVRAGKFEDAKTTLLGEF